MKVRERECLDEVKKDGKEKRQKKARTATKRGLHNIRQNIR